MYAFGVCLFRSYFVCPCCLTSVTCVCVVGDDVSVDVVIVVVVVVVIYIWLLLSSSLFFCYSFWLLLFFVVVDSRFCYWVISCLMPFLISYFKVFFFHGSCTASFRGSSNSCWRCVIAAVCSVSIVTLSVHRLFLSFSPACFFYPCVRSHMLL